MKFWYRISAFKIRTNKVLRHFDDLVLGIKLIAGKGTAREIARGNLGMAGGAQIGDGLYHLRSHNALENSYRNQAIADAQTVSLRA